MTCARSRTVWKQTSRAIGASAGLNQSKVQSALEPSSLALHTWRGRLARTGSLVFPKPRAPAPGIGDPPVPSAVDRTGGSTLPRQVCPADGDGATLESHTHRDRLLRGLLHAGPQLTLGLLTLTPRHPVSLFPFPHGSPDAQTGWMTPPRSQSWARPGQKFWGWISTMHLPLWLQ